MKSRRIIVLGAGPAGLYAALLIKKADPSQEITIIERNPADVTYGWGVVFSDRTLASFQRADYKTYQQITDDFVIWDSIDVRYRGETIRCGGHVIAAISRKRLLDILQRRCRELGVAMSFNAEVQSLADLPDHDLLIAADGVNSLVRKTYEDVFKPSIELGKAKYIWLGANKVLDAFNFIFHENDHGFFTVHSYPFSGTSSTFIVECDEQTWLNAGLDKADEGQSLSYCQTLLNAELGGTQLLSNNSKWINFPTLKTRRWSYQVQRSEAASTSVKPEPLNSEPHIVLLGDAVHTAHFSIGAGTKLAMEDAIALAGALEQHEDLQSALNQYELERKPVVETFQRAAQESRIYFETIKRYTALEPMQFAFQLLTRSGRISYDDLHFRDARFGDAVDRWYTSNAECEAANAKTGNTGSRFAVAPPPMFAPLKLRSLVLPSRIVMPLRPPIGPHALAGPSHIAGSVLTMTDIHAVSPDGRVSSHDITTEEGYKAAWTPFVKAIHEQHGYVCLQVGHAGRRGATRPRSEGLDRPMREGAWPLLSASPIPYTPHSQVPKEMERTDMHRVRDDFAHAAQLANEAGFDLLQLHFAHGYLVASFLSPLTNRRTDEYGGDIAGRTRFPLEVFDAVRAQWPQDKPISVAITASDHAKGGADIDDAIAFAGLLKQHGCDIIQVLAGQTTLQSEPPYSRGFLTSLSDRVRNGAGIPTLVGGYLTTSNEVNTILAAGRADLCLMAPGQ